MFRHNKSVKIKRPLLSNLIINFMSVAQIILYSYNTYDKIPINLYRKVMYTVNDFFTFRKCRMMKSVPK